MSEKTSEKGPKGFKAKDRYRDTPLSGIKTKALLEVARFTLVTEFPFFGKIAHAMEWRETDKVSTTAVDARGVFYYNPMWVNSFTKKCATFEVGHEVMHLVQRLWSRMPKFIIFSIWNRAADYLADISAR